MRITRQLLRYICSVGFYILFGFFLLLFHPIQIFCRHVLGREMHKKSVDLLNFFLLKCLYAVFSRSRFENTYQIPEGRPVIIVSNHQSMYDICMIVWYLRKYSPQFISKIELGRGIPSISYNLRHGGSVLIDRKNSRQAIPALTNFAKDLAHKKGTAVIFPEGTRSKTGEPKSFAPNGLKTLFKHMPDAVIVPVSINNSWKLLRDGMFPLDIGNTLSLKVQEPIVDYQGSAEELHQEIEARIISGINEAI